MAKTGKLLFSLICLFAVALAAEESIKVEAIVDRNEVGRGETLTLTVRTTSSATLSTIEPTLPDLSGFELEGTWTTQSSRSTFENGQFSLIQSLESNYTLRTTKKGAVTIGSVEVNVGGKIFKTQPIKIKVVDAGNGGGAGSGRAQVNPFDTDDPDDLLNMMLQNRGVLPPWGRPGTGGNAGPRDVNSSEAFFVDVEVSKNRVFKGEGIEVTFYLYTRGNILELDTLKHPEFQGFLREDIEIPQRLSFSSAVINGLQYSRAMLASHVVFPIKEGKLKIDEYKTQCKVILPASFSLGRPYRYTKSSKPVTIEVLPLPTAGQPPSFSGAVGSFEVAAKLERSSVPVNQPVSLKIRFEGTNGNAKVIELPHMELPPTVEVYDTKSDAKFFQNGKSYKEFEVLLIPRDIGVISIPAMEVAIFNPLKAQYETKVIPEQQLQVVADPAGKAIPSASLAGAKQEPSEVRADGLRLPGVAQGYLPSGTLSVAQRVGIWAAIYLSILLLLAWRSRLVLGWGEKRVTIAYELKRRFEAIERSANKGDFRRVGADLSNVIYFTLGAISEQGGGAQDTERLLLACPPSLQREYGEALKQLMDTTQAIGFAPDAMIGEYKSREALRRHVKQARQLLVQAVTASGSGKRDTLSVSASSI